MELYFGARMYEILTCKCIYVCDLLLLETSEEEGLFKTCEERMKRYRPWLIV